MVRERRGPINSAQVGEMERQASSGGGGGGGGYTDMEVLEVLDPPRAERIRLRMARWGKGLREGVL